MSDMQRYIKYYLRYNYGVYIAACIICCNWVFYRIYIYMYIFVYIYVYIYMRVYMYICVYIYIHTSYFIQLKFSTILSLPILIGKKLSTYEADEVHICAT